METKERTRRPAPKPAGTTGKTAAPARKPRPSGTRSRKGKPGRAPAPEVVYTQPGPFKRDKFILQLLTVVAVVLALVLGMAIFFKVGKIPTDQEKVYLPKVYVSGTEKYTAYDVVKASGINVGENLLTLREAEIGGRILEQLPYVLKARVRIKLPDAVNIEVVETDVVYAVQSTDASWWLMRSDGLVVEKTNSADAESYTKVLGITLAEPKAGKNAVALEPEAKVDETTGETLPVTVSAADQLRTAISILGFLESNSVIGEAASVDVSSLNNLELWYEDRYQVILGDSTRLGEKIRIMKATVVEMKDYDSGILDVSFTIKPGEVVYTPFA